MNERPRREEGLYWIRTRNQGVVIAKWYDWGHWVFIGNDQTFSEDDIPGLRVIDGPLRPPR